MKVNEVITEAGVWQGIKNVGRGLGRAVGGVATGAVKGLDILGGGSGDVGTATQRAQRRAAEEEEIENKIKEKLPVEALATFEQQMSEKGYNLNDPRTFNPQAMRQELKNFAVSFFAGGEERDIQSYIAQTVQFEPLPNQINRKTIRNYFNEITKIRANAFTWIQQNQASQQAQQNQASQQAQQPAANLQTAPAQPVSAGGVTLNRSAGRNNAGQPTPTSVTYQNHPFALMDDGRWVDVRSGKTVNTALASFLQTELESIS